MEMLSAFPPEFVEQKLIPNTYAIQLTEGCSGGCGFCSEDSPPLGEHFFSYDSLEQFRDKYGKLLPNVIKKGSSVHLYVASNPFDYKDGRHNFIDAARLFDARAISRMTPKMIKPFVRQAEDELIRQSKNGGIDLTSMPRMVIISDRDTPVDCKAKDKFRTMLDRHDIRRKELQDIVMGEYFHLSNATPKANLGRNYKPNQDFITCGVHHRALNGVEITPTGITGMLSVYPTPDNPRGRLEFPITNENDPVVLHQYIDVAGQVAPLPIAFAQPEKGLSRDQLPRYDDKEILREAYYLKKLQYAITVEYYEQLTYDKETKEKWWRLMFENARKHLQYVEDIIHSVQAKEDADLSETSRKIMPDMLKLSGYVTQWLNLIDQNDHAGAVAFANEKMLTAD